MTRHQFVPLICAWDGEVFRPISRHAKRASELVAGERYQFDVREERSIRSHNHYHAAVNEAWNQLPHGIDEQFPSANHLRARALIKTGFCDQTSFVCSSNAEALKLMAFLQPLDSFALITVDGKVVTRYVAHSQSYAGMDKQTFQRSKEAVLDWIAGLIGVESADLSDHVRRGGSP